MHSAQQHSARQFDLPSSPTTGPAAPVVSSNRQIMHNSYTTKGSKRKRLAKACDPCHKSKRRCDGAQPCSNCFYASKHCVYSPSNARSGQHSVQSAPNISQSAYIPHQDGLRHGSQLMEASTSGTRPIHERLPAPAAVEPLYLYRTRKRIRLDSLGASDQLTPPESPPTNNALPGSRPRANSMSLLEPSLTRELMSLFFAHCHPLSMMFHIALFKADLTANRVPSYLVYSMSAVAAPLSKQPRVRTMPIGCAGDRFARAAIEEMFDLDTGELRVERNLWTIQALVCLQEHVFFTAPAPDQWTNAFNETAIQILSDMNLYEDNAPTPFSITRHKSVANILMERECLRRSFWCTYMFNFMSQVFLCRPPDSDEKLLNIRLPVDETTFEGLSCTQTLDERDSRTEAQLCGVADYLFQPAPRARYGSEFGYVIRICALYIRINRVTNAVLASDYPAQAWRSVMELEDHLKKWESSLPENISFSEENLKIQLTMFQTSSNTGAWCFCFMHILHASGSLALKACKRRIDASSITEADWEFSRMDKIVSPMGHAAKRSPLTGTAIWTLRKYGTEKDKIDLSWSQYAETNEEDWTYRLEDYIPDRLRPGKQEASPPPGRGSPHMQDTGQARVVRSHHNHGHSHSHSHSHSHNGSGNGSHYSYRRNDTVGVHASSSGSSGEDESDGHERGHEHDHRRASHSQAAHHRSLKWSAHPHLHHIERDRVTKSASPPLLPPLRASGLMNLPVMLRAGHDSASHRATSPPVPPEATSTAAAAAASRAAKQARVGVPIGFEWLANEAHP